MRLIDADELLKVITENSYMLCDVSNSKDKGMFLCGIEQAINEMPTVDTERHGHWKIEQENLGNPIYVFTCSQCDVMFCDEDEYMVNAMNYCMNCGAKMDGDSE